jgi:hypothetical protein
MLDQDAVWILNRKTPIDRLAAMVSRPEVENMWLRPRLGLAAWTRAVLLERHDLAPGLAMLAADGFPALRPYLNAYLHTSDVRKRDIAATWTMLHTPGMTPWIREGVGRSTPPTERDPLHDNWWCRASEDRSAFLPGMTNPRSPIEAELYASGWDRSMVDAIVPAPYRARVERELARIDSLGPAPDVLCRRALAWADRSPSDPRLPEALALAVRSTRYGCSDKTTTAWSRRAYDRLHRRFPKSEWTRRTPYWY